MKKLMLGAAVSAALFAGAANAVINVDAAGKPIINSADTYEIFLSGASAPLTFIDQLFTNSTVNTSLKSNAICLANKTSYRYQNIGNGSDQRAYLCELNTANPALNKLAAGKKNLLVYKRSAGGSAMGVNPIIDNSPIDFMKVNDPTICNAPTVSGLVSTIACTYTAGSTTAAQQVLPDFGVSDVEPLEFQGANTPSGFNPVTVANLASLSIKPAAAQVFGIIVNTNLLKALQQAQFGAGSKCNPTNANYTEALGASLTCMPTLDSAQIASLFTGKIASWKQLMVTVGDVFTNVDPLATYAAGSDRVHICTRTNGSGTKASFSTKFLNYPCSDFATPPAVETGALAETTLQTQVHQMSSGGNVDECMGELNTGSNSLGTAFNNTYGKRWAIGIQGSENNASLNATTGAPNKDYRYIKVDGVEPTLANVANGRYKNWSELTFQYNTSHVFDTSEKNIVDEIIKEAGNPYVMAATNPAAKHAWGQSGFMAPPQFYGVPAGSFVNVAKPVNPLSHGTTAAAPSTCRAPALYNPGAAYTTGLQLIK